MASSVLVKDVLWRVSTLLQDQSPQWFRWFEGELVDWLNDAQSAIVKYLPLASPRVDAFKLVPGSRQSIEQVSVARLIPGDGVTLTLPVLGNSLLEVFRNMGADGVTPGRAIRSVDRDVLDLQVPNWHTVTGAAVQGYMYDPRFPRHFLVTPAVPATPDVWIELGYTAQPIAIPNTGTAGGGELYSKSGSSTQKLSLSDEYADDLVNFVVARANMKPVEWADAGKAAAFTTLFTSSLNAKVIAVTGNNPNLTRLPFAPEPVGRAK